MNTDVTGPFMQMFTEADNYTQDLFRWLACLAIIVGLGLEIYCVVWLQRTFDIQTFGIGVGVLFVGMGAALRLKAADSIPGGTTTTAISQTTTTTQPPPPPSFVPGAGTP